MIIYFKKKKSMKTLSEFELKVVLFLLSKKSKARKEAETYERQLVMYQERCGHPAIKTSSHEDFVIKFKGCCPDCGKIILSESIIKMLRGQYSKKD